MENIYIEIPVSIGDKLYRTNSNCEIDEGEVVKIYTTTEFYKVNKNQSGSNQKVEITVSWGYCNNVSYNPEELGVKVFSTKEDLIKCIVGKL